MQEPPPNREYRCPGERHAVSRAVHLGRLAAFYPGCRQCPQRHDTGTLSPRQIEQLAETDRRGQCRPLFHDEGAGGVYLNDLTPVAARQIAAAFGAVVAADARSRLTSPAVVLAGDGRAMSAELVAAAGEGLRGSGCYVTDIGPATAACLAFAVKSLAAAGGLLVGNPSHEPHVVGLQFWASGAMPLSSGGTLEPIIERFRQGTASFTRPFGGLRRLEAEKPYLDALFEHYHALRPLRLVVHSSSGPFLRYLQRLAAAVACEIIAAPVARRELPEQVRAESAHFAACVDGDGETCGVQDERGREVPAERLLLWLATAMPRQAPLIVEEGISAALRDGLKRLGTSVTMVQSRRAAMAAAMRSQGALLGGGPSGRFWHTVAGVALPDALMTITRLLVLLSRSDEPFSAVLDREARIE